MAKKEEKKRKCTAPTPKISVTIFEENEEQDTCCLSNKT